MRVLSTVLAFVLFSFVGCTSELPTTPEGEDALLGKAAQGDRSEWEPFEGWSWTDFSYDAGFVSCINNGQGEDVTWTGSGQWLKKEVVTPSGNTNLNLTFWLSPDSRITGMQTGEVWAMDRYNSHFHMNTRHSDGHTFFVQPDTEWFTSELTGKRVKLTWLAKAEWDENFEPVVNEMKIQCALRGPK